MAPKRGEAGGRLLGGRGEPTTCSIATGTRTDTRICEPQLGIASRVRSPQLACPFDALRTVTIRLVPRSPAATVPPGSVRAMELLVGRDLLILLMLALGITLATSTCD